MTIVIGTTSVDGSTMNAGSGEDLILPDGVVVSTATGSGIRASASDSDLLIMGKVFGQTYGVEMGSNADVDGRNTLTMMADSIASGYYAGVRTVGKFAVIDNAGLIRGTGEAGIWVSNNEYTNAVTIRNTGTIQGVTAGIVVVGGAMRLINYGRIAGGETNAAIQGGYAVDHITNRGLIDGSIGTSSSDDVVINRGTVTGPVSMGEGADRVDNRGGVIEGDITLGAGDDIYLPGASAETVDAGLGTDWLDFRAATVAVTLALDASVNSGGWAAGDDFTGFENVVGSNLGDTLIGDDGANTLNGMRGADSINGLGGNDIIDGGSGADTLNGGKGADTLKAGTGNDILIGGVGTDVLRGDAGADQFRFDDADFGGTNETVADQITDFSHAEGDRIHLSLVDAKTATSADDAFTYIGSKAFTGVAGQLRSETGNGKTYVMGDTDGNAIADFWIVLTGTMTLVKGDFVL